MIFIGRELQANVSYCTRFLHYSPAFLRVARGNLQKHAMAHVLAPSFSASSAAISNAPNLHVSMNSSRNSSRPTVSSTCRNRSSLLEGKHFKGPFRSGRTLRLKKPSDNAQKAQKICALQSAGTLKEDVQLASLFEGLEVLSTSGERKKVLDLWRDRRVVVAWARHFGCLLCKKRAAQMVQRKKELDAAGVTLVIIGPGNPDQAKSFKEQTEFQGEVYADPTSETFQKLGFVFGPGSIFTPKSLANLVGASLEGFKQDWGLSFQRDTVLKGGWQQGGVVVAGPGVNTCLFLHKDKEAGDEPDWDDVVQAALES